MNLFQKKILIIFSLCVFTCPTWAVKAGKGKRKICIQLPMHGSSLQNNQELHRNFKHEFTKFMKTHPSNETTVNDGTTRSEDQVARDIDSQARQQKYWDQIDPKGEMRRRQDELLDQISAGLTELGQMSREIGHKLDQQNQMLDEVNTKTDSTNQKLENTNKRVQDIQEAPECCIIL